MQFCVLMSHTHVVLDLNLKNMQVTSFAGFILPQGNQSLVHHDQNVHYHPLEEVIIDFALIQLDMRTTNLISVYFSIHSCTGKNVHDSVVIQNDIYKCHDLTTFIFSLYILPFRDVCSLIVCDFVPPYCSMFKISKQNLD